VSFKSRASASFAIRAGIEVVESSVSVDRGRFYFGRSAGLIAFPIHRRTHGHAAGRTFRRLFARTRRSLLDPGRSMAVDKSWFAQWKDLGSNKLRKPTNRVSARVSSKTENLAQEGSSSRHLVDIRSPISPERHAKGYSPPTGLRARYSPADAGQCSLKQLHPQGLPVPLSLTDTAPQSLNDHLRLPCAECDGHGS